MLSSRLKPNREPKDRANALAPNKNQTAPNEKWGPALLPAPTAPSEGSAGVRDLDRLRSPVLRSWLTSSGVASDHGCIRRHILDLPRPFLDRSSFRAFRSPGCLAAAAERSKLPAPLASWSSERPICLHPEGFQRLVRITIACRRRSDLWSLVVSGEVALPFDGLEPLPRSPFEYAPRPESLQAESFAPSLWITGISCITLRRPRLPFRSSPPNSGPCPNPLPFQRPNPRISPA